MVATISQINQRVWTSKEVALEYYNHEEIFPAEDWILEHFAQAMSNARLLDIGVGAGRTTSFLRMRCASYIGIDYSPQMIRVAKDKFPTLDLRQLDARDLSAFADNAFTMVWFPYNGIDYLTHEERKDVLREVHRVLAPGGQFVFSTHNRDSVSLPAYSLRHLKLSLNPKRCIGNCLRYIRGIYRHLKLAPLQVKTDEYEIRNDPAQGYKLLTYYISLDQQIKILQELGFAAEMFLGVDGKTLSADSSYPDDYCIYYVAKQIPQESVSNSSSSSAA